MKSSGGEFSFYKAVVVPTVEILFLLSDLVFIMIAVVGWGVVFVGIQILATAEFALNATRKLTRPEALNLRND
jgi:hypothetical protein